MPDQNQKAATDSPATVSPELIDAERLAGMLSISPRTLYRLKRGGFLPDPIRLGGSVRWRLRDIERWIGSGCPRS